MSLPFSHDAFLDAFGAYNTDVGWAVVGLWLLTSVLAVRWLRQRHGTARGVLALLALHWAWSGAVYHWMYSRTIINAAATAFGAAFLLQAVLLAWLAVRGRARLDVRSGARGGLGVGLVSYGLVYPFIGLLAGLQYPRLPLFAVPCPTTLVTAGLFLMMRGIPRLAFVIPILWAAIGASAAFALGIRADMALVGAAAILTLDALAPRALTRLT